MKYTAIIGDIRNSKQLGNRGEVQAQLQSVLEKVNEDFAEDIAAKFLITLGDEFQGLLRDCSRLFQIIQFLQMEMYPVEVRFGVGIGKISTQIMPETAIGADGPAFYAAREVIGQIHDQEKRLKKQVPDVQIRMYEREDAQLSQINTILALMKVVEAGWSAKQRMTIWDMMRHGGSQEACAQRMQVAQSTIARRLAEGSFITYERAGKTVKEALMRMAAGMDQENKTQSGCEQQS